MEMDKFPQSELKKELFSNRVYAIHVYVYISYNLFIYLQRYAATIKYVPSYVDVTPYPDLNASATHKRK